MNYASLQETSDTPSSWSLCLGYFPGNWRDLCSARVHPGKVSVHYHFLQDDEIALLRMRGWDGERKVGASITEQFKRNEDLFETAACVQH